MLLLQFAAPDGLALVASYTFLYIHIPGTLATNYAVYVEQIRR
jgi:hypothetical protein